MTETAELTHALFTVQSGKHQGTEIPVHFNPVSLEYSVTNTLKEGSGSEKAQFVSQSSGKLTMELIFDTTHSGEDVRKTTDQVAQLMEPDAHQAPPKVRFEWGVYKFEGMVESYKETIDFFASNGVPLRASVNLTLSRQDKVFDNNAYFEQDPTKTPQPDAVDLAFPSDPNASGDQGAENATDIATRSGDARAGRAIAAANSLNSMRFPSGPLTVDASIQLRPPAAFASGSLSVGASAGIGIGGGVGIGGGIGGGGGVGIGGSIGAGGGISGSGNIGGSIGGGVGGGVGIGGGIGASAGFSAGASVSVGGRASAGVSASAGAFAGLKTASRSPSIRLTPSRLIPPRPSANLTFGSGSSFQVGGKANATGASGLQADVGLSVDLRTRIRFEES